MEHIADKLYYYLATARRAIQTSTHSFDCNVTLASQTDGLVEHFNQTLKVMLSRFADSEGKDWDKIIP